MATLKRKIKQTNKLRLSKTPTKKGTESKNIKQTNKLKLGRGKTVLKVTKRRVIKRKKV